MPKHQDIVQLRATGDGAGNPRRITAVRPKVSGFNSPEQTLEFVTLSPEDSAPAVTCDRGVSLVTTAEPRNREIEIIKARERSKLRRAPLILTQR